MADTPRQPHNPPRWSAGWILHHLSRALLGQFNVPAWLAILLAIYIGVPDWHARNEFWLQAAKSSGGYMGTVAAVLLWPYFAPLLAISAMVYLVAVNTAKHHITRHPAVPIGAWVCVAMCFVALIATTGYGVVEIYIRREIAKGIVGIPRNTPDSPTRPQTPIYAGVWGLTPDQIRILVIEFQKLKPHVETAALSFAPTDNQAAAYVQPLREIFDRVGITCTVFTQSPRDASEQGLMLEVHDPKNIPFRAQKLREALEIANIHLRIIEMPSNLRTQNRDFIVFIGPRPIS